MHGTLRSTGGSASMDRSTHSVITYVVYTYLHECDQKCDILASPLSEWYATDQRIL